jgi:amino acid adenylation domain-containing protein
VGQVSELAGVRDPRAGQHRSHDSFPVEDVEQTVGHRFEQQAARYPDRIAVKTRVAVLTYDALNRRANRVAHAVIAQHGAAEDPVALLLDPGASFVIASLGVLKAGRIQVPLKSTVPHARMRYMLDQSQATTLVTNETNLVLARELGVPTLINIDELDQRHPSQNPDPGLRPDAKAAIVYTSGSTGQPKGIVWNHRGVLHAVMRHTNAYHVRVRDRMAAHGGIRAYLYPLLNGATFYPVQQEEEPASLAAWLAQERITVYRTPVSAFRRFVAAVPGAEQFPHLRLVQVYGEAIYPTDVELFRQRFAARCVLATSLGCSEFDDYACSFIDMETPLVGTSIPGGDLMADTSVLLLDDDGRAVEVGQVGEIVIRSRYNAVGYWHRPDLTQAAFVPDPADRAGSLYRTGDLGRIGRDGRLFHAGRKDFQVKIRGHRVEVAEVEAALLGVEGVESVAVVGRERAPGDMRLVAYVAPAGPRRPDVASLRRHLARTVPEYMVPSAFVWLDTLPLTPTGKVDRRALPLPDGTRPALGTPFVGPATPLEHQLQQIWEGLLDVRPIGTEDNFFDLGGHSLLAVQVAQAIEAATGRRLPLSALFIEGATIQHQAQVLREPPTGVWAPAMAFHEEGSQPPFFFLHGDYGGNGLYCHNLARALGPDQPFYALHPHGIDGGPIPGTIEAMALDHLATVRAIQPHGPYRLGGLCNGGVIAFELARRLQAAGERVVFLGLLDASAENARLRSRLLRWLADSLGAVRGLTRRERLLRFIRLRQCARALGARTRYYCRRLPEVSRLSRDDRLAVLRRTAMRCRTVLASLVWKRREVDVPAPGSVNVDSRDRFEESYRLALAGYVPRRYSGAITLFRSGPYQRRPADLGWRVVAPRVEIYDIPGEHLTSITRHVDVLGARVRACLEKAR